MTDAELEKMAQELLHKAQAWANGGYNEVGQPEKLVSDFYQALRTVRDAAVRMPSELIIEPKPGTKRFMTKTVHIEHEGALEQELSTCTEQGQGVSLDLLGMRLRSQITNHDLRFVMPSKSKMSTASLVHASERTDHIISGQINGVMIDRKNFKMQVQYDFDAGVEWLRSQLMSTKQEHIDASHEHVDSKDISDQDFEKEWEAVSGTTFRPKEQALHFWRAAKNSIKALSDKELTALALKDSDACQICDEGLYTQYMQGYRAAEARMLGEKK